MTQKLSKTRLVTEEELTQDNSSTYSANTKADARTAQVRGGRKPLGRRNGNLISILTYLRPKYIKSKYIK